MARSALTWMRAAAAVVALATPITAQQCYYPNGNKAPDTDKPCSSAAGSACCPDNWECLDNGLCHYPPDNLFGRYSCTDQSWKSPGCASNMCTYGMSVAGGESITQCSNHDNNWCCNADATHVNCCQESPSPRPFFALQDGRAYATIGRNQASTVVSLASITGLATGSGSDSKTSVPVTSATPSSNANANAASSHAPASSVAPFTSVQVSVSSGTAGIVTVRETIVVTPASSPGTANNNSSSSGGSTSNIGLIVGCAVGIPLALALLGIIIWMLRKRRQQKANSYKETAEMDGNGHGTPSFAGGAAAKLGKNDAYRHSRPGTAEIDSNPVGPGQSVSNIPGHAELESGADFRPGHGPAYAPHTVGLGGGTGDGRSTWGSAPPGYSPGTNQAAFAHAPAAAELDATNILPAINEKDAAPQQHQAYRPLQPAAELPTVKTPPEDVEKQMHR